MADHARRAYEDRDTTAFEMPKSAEELGERAMTIAGEIGAAVKERPYTSLAVAAGLAFAIGALWKMSGRRPSRMDGLLAHLPSDWQSRAHELSRRWL